MRAGIRPASPQIIDRCNLLRKSIERTPVEGRELDSTWSVSRNLEKCC
jgi:hypothetical protein